MNFFSSNFFYQLHGKNEIWKLNKTREIVGKLIFSIILFLLSLPFLLWSSIIINDSQIHFDGFIIPGSIIFIPSSFFLIGFIASLMVYCTVQSSKYKQDQMPVSFKLSIFGSLFLAIWYISIFLLFWIPYLPVSKLNNTQVLWGTPFFLLSVMSPATICMWIIFRLILASSSIEIDNTYKNIFLQGKTFLGISYNYKIPLNSSDSFICFKHPSNEVSGKDNFWGLYLKTDSFLYRLFSNRKENVDKFANEISKITGFEINVDLNRDAPNLLLNKIAIPFN